MASPNINLRDPVIYRIRTATHHRTGDNWCIYPMYTYAHPIEDALENITHSLCTLEFEDQRPFYDWLLEQPGRRRTAAAAAAAADRVRAPESHLRGAVQAPADSAGGGRHVEGWDDPRMPTLVGRAPPRLHARRLPALRRPHRRREGRFVDRLFGARRLHARRPQRARRAAHRRAGSGEARDRQLSRRTAKRNASRPTIRRSRSCGKRSVPFTRELWIEREDFSENAAQRLLPAVPRQQRAAALRLRREMHRLRQGRPRAT